MSQLIRIMRRGLTQGVPTMIVIAIINFFMIRLAPGNGADYMAAEFGTANPELMKELQEKFGVNVSLYDQFVNYMYNLAHFDLGVSPRYNAKVIDLILERLPNSMMLMLSALGLALAVGIILGLIMSLLEGTLLSRVVSAIVSISYSMPSFWVAFILIFVFSIKLSWFPSGGVVIADGACSGLCYYTDALNRMVLPSISLAIFYATIYARLVRSSVRNALGEDYIRTATAKGNGSWRINAIHVLPNALLPLLTVAGTHFGGIIGGSVVIETIFNWPGFGRLAFEAVVKRDFTVLSGILLFSSLIVIIVNMIVDALQSYLDPRIDT